MTRVVIAALAALGIGATPMPPQPAPSSAPTPKPAREDTLTTTYSVGNLRVIHRRTNVSTVVMNVYLLGGVRSAPPGLDGIENFLLQVSERGTQKYSRDVLRRAEARTGAEVVVEPREDWTMIGVRTTPETLDSSWSILADRIVHPRIDSVDVEFIRDQLLAAVRQRQDSPDALLDYLSDSVAYAGNPYAASSVGTEETLSRITRADLLRYHREQFSMSRMLLVVIGNVDRATVERMVRTTLGTLPAGSYAWSLPDTMATTPGDAVIIRRSLPTNYLQGYFQGPAANSPDAPALRVAAAVLSGRLFGEVRSKRNLTYAVSANYRDRALTSVGLYVTTTLPDSVLVLMAREVRTLQTFEIQTEFLAPVIRQFITEYFLDNETSTAQADFLARALLYRGDITAGDHFVSDLRAVTGADVRRVAQRYFRNAHWGYIGDPSRVTIDRLIRF